MEHLFPYWRRSLYEMPRDIMHFRHATGTTGWSMASQAWFFAWCLFDHEQITASEHARWVRFGQHCRAWESRSLKSDETASSSPEP